METYCKYYELGWYPPPLPHVKHTQTPDFDYVFALDLLYSINPKSLIFVWHVLRVWYSICLEKK